MADFRVPQIDFSWLGQLPQEWEAGKKAGQEQGLSEDFAKLMTSPDGTKDFPKMAAELFAKHGMAKEAITLLAQQSLTPGERQSHLDKMMELQAQYPGMFVGGQPSAQTAGVASQAQTPQAATAQEPDRPVLPYPLPRDKTESEANNAAVKEWAQVKAKLGTPDQQEKMYQAQSGGLDAMLDTIDKIRAYDKKDSPIPSFMGGGSMLDAGTGMLSSAGKVPGTEGYDLQALQRQLIEQAKLTAFQSLKDASVTGSSGLARTAVVEFNSMANKQAALDWKQSKPAYTANLDKLEAWARAAKKGLLKPPSMQGKETGLPETAPPSAGDVPIQGASTVAQHQAPEQTKAVLDGIPDGQTGTVHLSDGSSMKVIKRGDSLYDINTGKRIQY